MSNKRDDLKPCPFCGGKAGFATWICEGGEKEYSVMCDDCDADVYPSETKEEAAEKWNRRAFEDESISSL